MLRKCILVIVFLIFSSEVFALEEDKVVEVMKRCEPHIVVSSHYFFTGNEVDYTNFSLLIHPGLRYFWSEEILNTPHLARGFIGFTINVGIGVTDQTKFSLSLEANIAMRLLTANNQKFLLGFGPFWQHFSFDGITSQEHALGGKLNIAWYKFWENLSFQGSLSLSQQSKGVIIHDITETRLEYIDDNGVWGVGLAVIYDVF